MGDSTMVKSILAGSAAAVLVHLALEWKRNQTNSAPQVPAPAAEEISTTSSGHSGNVYETDKAVGEYLMFHFGTAQDLLPYKDGPVSALDFAARTARLCAHWCRAAGTPLDAALDIGCAVGGSCFEFSREFSRVVGIDFSHAFVAAANNMKANGSAPYTMQVEGSITTKLTAVVPPGARSERITFEQGDACNLNVASLAQPGKFNVIHAANLLCRLPDPAQFLHTLPKLLVPGGLAIFISPYSWLPQYTEKSKWLGGTVGADDKVAHWSKDGLGKIMTSLGFVLIHQEDCPFLIREHARKFQWGCSHVTVWHLKK